MFDPQTPVATAAQARPGLTGPAGYRLRRLGMAADYLDACITAAANSRATLAELGLPEVAALANTAQELASEAQQELARAAGLWPGSE